MKGCPSHTVLSLLFGALQGDARSHPKGSTLSTEPPSCIAIPMVALPALSWPPCLTTPKHPSFGIIANSHYKPLTSILSGCVYPPLPPSLVFLSLSTFLCHQPLLSPLLRKESYTQVSFYPSLKAQVFVNILVRQSSKSWLYKPSFIRCS